MGFSATCSYSGLDLEKGIVMVLGSAETLQNTLDEDVVGYKFQRR